MVTHKTKWSTWLGALVLSCGLLVGCTTPGGYYETAQRAYGQQNYGTAFSNMLVSARFGNMNAAYGVGYMYYYGIGVPQNIPLAMFWIRRAARAGQVQANRILPSLEAREPDYLFISPAQQDRLTRISPPAQTRYPLRTPRIPMPV